MEINCSGLFVGKVTYMFNRTVSEWFSCFVAISNYESNYIAMTLGVPQGSILGPLLFSLSMLALAQILQNSTVDHHKLHFC